MCVRACVCTRCQAKLERLGFSPEEEEALTTQRGALATEVDALSDKCDNLEASLSARLRFDYDAAAVDRACRGRAGAGAGAGAKGDRVKGVVAKLITVKDTAAATALEVSAGDKLYQVVVDTEVTGKALLQKGKLRRRVTVIPLNKIRRSTLRDSQIEAARRVSRGAAVPALSLVGYTDEVEAAMEYVFGRAFVCPDSDTAQAVTFHKDVRARTVTLDGDMFDPSGTLSGGSRRQAGAVLVKLQELTAAREALGAKKEQLAALDRRIAGLEAASAQFTKLSGEADIQRHKVELLRGEVAASQHQQLVDELAAVEAQLEAATQGVDACLAAAEEARAAVARIEDDMRNVEERRQRAIKEVDAKVRTPTAQLPRRSPPTPAPLTLCFVIWVSCRSPPPRRQPRRRLRRPPSWSRRPRRRRWSWSPPRPSARHCSARSPPRRPPSSAWHRRWPPWRPASPRCAPSTRPRARSWRSSARPWRRVTPSSRR